MALCTSIVNAAGVNYLVLDGVNQPETCPGSVVLGATEYAQWVGQATLWGWDTPSVEFGFASLIGLWVLGLTVGVALGVVRKARAH